MRGSIQVYVPRVVYFLKVSQKVSLMSIKPKNPDLPVLKSKRQKKIFCAELKVSSRKNAQRINFFLKISKQNPFCFEIFKNKKNCGVL